MKTLKLKEGLYWTGILDPQLRVFDIIMNTEYGTTYNSYLLKGSEKTALFETAKAKCMDEYLDKLTSLIDIKDIDYIIVDHTEPDHAGSAEKLIEMNPAIKLVGTATAISFMKEICNTEFSSVIVKEGDTLSLGDKTLRFIAAPNLHWPDAMYTYVEEDKVLLTCDSFGAHYSFDQILSSKITDQDAYMSALRYYFDNIMGPFKPYVLKAIDKIRDLEIDMVCPGHGPVLDEDPWKIINIYKGWSTEVNPNTKKTVVIPYVAAYGYTQVLADKITEGIKASGDVEVKLFDMVTSDQAEVLGELYWADGILFGTPTILGEALKPIWDLTTSIYPVTHGGKIASAFGSYGWSGEAVPHMVERLKQLRMKVYGKGLRVRFKPSEAQLAEAYEFGYNFGRSVIEGAIVEPEPVSAGNRRWKCLVCGEIIEGPKPPESCPVCGVGPEQFVEVPYEEVTFSSSERDNIVVVGSGIAALSACEEIRKRNQVCGIEIISSESVFCYNRPMLTKGILSEFDALNFFTKQLDWYQENNITLTLDTTVEAIDTSAKKLTLSGGQERKYDKLILATGAECNIPPIKGADNANVFSIRKLADANAIRERINQVNDIAVIGGGVLGLEAAWEFRRAGKNVTILEVSDGLMKNQLDQQAAQLLKEAAEKSGLTVITGAKIEQITESGVDLADGTKIAGQMVIISAGVKPNSAVAVTAGIEGDRWIKVNEKMETSAEGVYACGDVAALNGVSIGIWSQGLEMGKVAGANAAGDSLTYKPVTPSNSYSGMGINLFAIGDNGKKEGLNYKAIQLADPAKGIYKKLYFVNNRFTGGILIGDVNQSAKLLEGYEKKQTLEDMMSVL
ncbi:FAD-dependent oxidoreductase [Anaerovorax odorimutans]|uniref:FAD-dependent oxidoreductase n=1 Tax=Anaerovorax odorimutans TaxID=109327 RepID=A0ABT1RQR6_9FIRM|nr:FAD-dependent oxidoreductase [Anaerovorax odorimutans]MCQ4637508.1 FAD-dependent oxidoreductase [Anaerovorax odorimutans]